MRGSILRSKLRPTGTSHRKTSALPNIRRRNATRRITAGQIARLHALLPHLLTHLHEPRNAVLNRRMRGKQAREALRGERTGDHHRSHRLRAGGLLHRHRGCAAGNLAQRGSERFRILRQLGTVFVGVVFACAGDCHLYQRRCDRRQNRAQQHTQQSQAAGRRIVAVVTRTAAAEIHERVAEVRDDGGHGGGDCGRQNVVVVDVHEFVSEHAANLTFVKRL